MNTKICSNCNTEKDYSYFYKHKKHRDGFRGICISCFKYKKSTYQSNNKAKTKDYIEKHNSKYKEIYGVSYNTFKRKKDPLFNLVCNIRRRLLSGLKRKKWTKIATFKEYIGCDLYALRCHFESLFQAGMTWENHGLHGWHIDHIIPISSAKTEEDIINLSHYTNLQPLWAIDNLKKSDKF